MDAWQARVIPPIAFASDGERGTRFLPSYGGTGSLKVGFCLCFFLGRGLPPASPQAGDNL
jgi:hypothetical protein